ncbi:MAG: methyltransferase domain-containing protein [Myxococcales bacterium]|nr:methyltransferase domain-containing protein [Myxococcales bacterium]MCE7889113.1 class I SAM-dependent methyltransferase [Sorangiineae bacterium PRO1]
MIDEPSRYQAFWRVQHHRTDNDVVLARVPTWLAETMQGLFRTAMLSRITAHLGGRELAHALDLGCGVGDWTLGYLGFARRVTGVDINETFLGVARRRAAALGVDARASFEAAALEAFPVASDIDFVGLGACLMYVPDVRVNRLLAKVAGGMQNGGFVYVRSTVMAPLRRRQTTAFGVYRCKEEYETLFRCNGFSVLDCAYSSGVVADFVGAGISHSGARRLATRSLDAVARLGRAAKNHTEYYNWLLCRSPGGE